jgi:hypothetical protein
MARKLTNKENEKLDYGEKTQKCGKMIHTL